MQNQITALQGQAFPIRILAPISIETFDKGAMACQI